MASVSRDSKVTSRFRSRAIKVLAANIGATLILAALLVWLNSVARAYAAEAREARRRILTQTQLIARLADLRRERSRAEELFLRLRLLLPDTERLLLIPGEIEARAAASGVSSAAFLFGSESPATAEEPRAIGVNFSFLADLASLTAYLRDLGELPYTIRLNEIDVLRRSGSSPHQVNASGKMYTR